MKKRMSEEELNRGMDLKRLMLYFQRKFWLVLMLAIVGGVFGGVIYQMIRSMKMPVEYETVSKLYISFGTDETGEVYQYYNGYTWNDLLDTDPIMELIMLNLPGYEKEQVQEATTAEILSDIRLLTVTVTGESEKFVREIRDAVEKGLTEYARESKELDQIRAIRSGAPQRVYWDDRTTAACITGATLLGVLTLLILGFSYALNEAVFVQEDVEKKYAYKALGLLTRNQKGLQPYAGELKANIAYCLRDHKRFAILDMANHGDVRKAELERLLNRNESEVLGVRETDKESFGWQVGDDEDNSAKGEWEVEAFNENVMDAQECEKIREIGGVVLLLPFGNDVGRRTSRILSLLKNQDCPVLGIIIAQAEEEFLNRYYA